MNMHQKNTFLFLLYFCAFLRVVRMIQHLVFLVGGFCVSGVVVAEEVNRLETITVSATKSAETATASQSITKFQHELLDIPFNKTSLAESVLKQQDIQRIDQALNLVSGVSNNNSYGGGFWDNYSFRGFEGNPNTGVEYIRNGLSVNRGIAAPRDMVNVESLDFLKGPNAALYGRGEIGGALNITTKKPSWNSASALNFRASSLEEYRFSAEHTAPINQQVAYRLGIAVEDNQSFRDHVSSERLFVAPQLSWKLSQDTQLDLDTEFSQHLGTFDRGLTAVNNQITMDKKTFTGEPNDGDMRVKDNLYQLRLAHQLNDVWKINGAVSYKDAQMVGYSTEPRKIQADLRTLERQRRYRDYQTEDLMAQVETLGQFEMNGLAHEFVLGAEVGRFHFMQQQYRLNHSENNPNWIDIYRPVYGQFSPAMPLHTDSDENQRYIALNLQDQVFLNDQWNLLMGVRWDRVEQDFENHLKGLKDQSTHNQLSPRIGMNYRPTENWSLYANYGEAFSMNSGMSRTLETFEPETAKSYEVGSKWQWADANTLSLAWFDMRKNNVLMTDAIDPNFEAAAGEVSSRGVEFDLIMQLNEQLKLSANYAWVDAKVTKDKLIAKGAPLTNVPEHSANINVVYEPWYSIGLMANLSYVGSRSGDSPTNVMNGFRLPAYQLVDVGAYYQATPELRYQLNIHNLLDESYYRSSYSHLWVQAGEPVKASVAVQWTF